MRKIALLVLAASACGSGAAAPIDPPVLTITSPVRALVQGQSGQVTVTGTVAPGASGDVVKTVTVNDTAATLNADGSFSATITVGAGTTLIQTVATDERGGAATDVRALQAGALKPVGSNIPSAVTAAMSTDSFAKLSAAAGPLIKGLDLGKLVAPLQPLASFGSTCLAQGSASVDDVKLGDIQVTLTPTAGGLMFRAELDAVKVPGHATYRAACLPTATTHFTVSANKVVVAGTLDVKPNGMAGFSTKIVRPDVQLTGFDLSASGLPGDILDLIDFNGLVTSIVPSVAELAMNPLFNKALGALSGPQQLAVAGQQLSMQVVPSAIDFDASGALLALDMKMAIAGSESSPGFVYTENGTPALDPSHGFQVGIADDLANEMLAELTATGKLDLALPVPGGLFDTAAIHMALPPSVSADASDGKLRVVLGDMVASFMTGSNTVAKAAINAKLDFKVSPTTNGAGVAVQLGEPEIHINVLDDVQNTTGFSDDTLAKAVSAVLGAQIDSISQLLVAVPLPSIDGIQVSNLSIDSDMGYVMVRGEFQ
ncbi:MAG TPA: hypothetical protein VFP84_17650 [Kofleriaceae bacterium]|nr:hypothetical protein [Kofleriaceae bacterium]